MAKPTSDALYARAMKRIPMATQTSSKGAFRFANGFGPKFLSHGRGCEVVDVDGERYIDWTMALGAVTAGYANPRIEEEVREALDAGNLLTLPTEGEVRLAEMLCDLVPGMEMVRFLKSGSDATTAAVRLARAYTGRDKIVRCGYHGWHDWALNADYQDKLGVPQAVRDLTVSVPFNDFESLEDHLLRGDCAAFILEPVSLVAPYDWYLPKVRELCTKVGTVLIFDEVITGIRMAPGGAQSHYNVQADLVALGKGLANGHSISAVGGLATIMQRFTETHISGTYYGEMQGIAAARATITELALGDFWTHQKRVGARVMASYRDAVKHFGAEAHTTVMGLPHFFSVTWKTPEQFTLFQQEMMRRGVLFSGNFFPCLAHREEQIETTARAFRSSMQVVASAIQRGVVEQRLDCAVNQTVFRRH